MPPSVEFHPDAGRELKAAFCWYHDRHEASAKAFALEMDIAVERIVASPTRRPPINRSIRRYLLKRFPFSVIYRVKGARIEIIAVAHVRRGPRYWESR